MPTGLASPVHLLVILTVALIVLGPERLPGAARQLGKAVGEVRRWTSTVQDELRGALDFDDEPTPPIAAVPDLGEPPSETASASVTPRAATVPPKRPVVPSWVVPLPNMPPTRPDGEGKTT